MKLKIYNTTKKLFLLVFIYQFFSCETQSNGFLKIDDDYSLKVRGLVENYSKNSTSEMVNFISDSVIIYFNNDSFLGLNMLISEFENDHKMFSKIQIEDIKTHTLYFKNNRIITEQSFEWHADGNFSKSHIHTSLHLNYYWKNDKVNKIIAIFDSEDYLNEEILFNKEEN